MPPAGDGEAPAAGVTVATGRGRLLRLLDSEGLRFLLVGGFNTVFGFGVFAGLQSASGARVHYLVVLVVAQVIAVLEAYVLQRWLVFRARGRWWRDLVRFSSVYVVSLGVNVVALPLLVEVFGVPVVPAQGLVMLGTALGTYVVHRTFTFRHTRGAARPAHHRPGADGTSR